MATVNETVNYLLHLRNEDEDRGFNFSLTNLKLQKLLYFCHAMFAVSKNGELLIKDATFQAWRYGPVIPEVYYRFNIHGQSEIPLIVEGNFNGLDKIEIRIIEEVWTTLRDKSAFDLVEISHARGGPWDNAFSEGENNEIKQSDILEFFGGKL